MGHTGVLSPYNTSDALEDSKNPESYQGYCRTKNQGNDALTALGKSCQCHGNAKGGIL